MLSLQWIRENTALAEAVLRRRGVESCLPLLLSLDAEHRECLTRNQKHQEAQNILARQVPDAKKRGDDIAPLLEEAQTLKGKIQALETQIKALREKIDFLLYRLPNILSEDVPDGASEEENVLYRAWGTPPLFSFPPLTHDVLGEGLGLMQFDLAAHLSGSRFVVLRGALAQMERALGQFMLDVHTREFGYEEVSPPLLVRPEAAFGVGQLPKFEEDLFKTTTDHYLISTAEVPLTNLVANKILLEKDLPLRFTALTPCFRSEAGAAGRDTQGMIRMHQFYKVELVSIVTPAMSKDEHERMLTAAEEILRRLELPYRVMILCAGDIGFCSQKTYDIEVWLPSQNTYREISSCSNFGDYQARRMQARYRCESKNGALPPVHTLNGSGVALGRALLAILENYQQPDGSIVMPEALRPYLTFDKIESRQ